jgi:hypothetical protein
MSKSEQQQLSILKPENSIGQEPCYIKGHWAELILQPSHFGEFCFLKGQHSRNRFGGAA